MLVKFFKGGAYLLRKCTGVNQGWRGVKGRRRDKEEKKTHANMEEEEEKSLAAVRATRKREEDGNSFFLGGRLHIEGVESYFGILGIYNELAFDTL